MSNFEKRTNQQKSDAENKKQNGFGTELKWRKTERGMMESYIVINQPKNIPNIG